MLPHLLRQRVRSVLDISARKVLAFELRTIDSFSSWVLGCSAALCLIGCGSDDAEAAKPRAFALGFAAVADGKHVGCDDRVEGLGPDGSNSVGLADLRFYVTNLKFWDAAKREVAVTLDKNDFQYSSKAGQVSLVDLTSNAECSCAGNAVAFSEGTQRTNDAITGQSVVERVKSVSFGSLREQAIGSRCRCSSRRRGFSSAEFGRCRE